MEQIRQQMSGHWDAWFDEKIPALGDQTPREAARTAQGRELLEALLCDYAWNSQRLPDTALSPDVEALRRELGM